MVDRGFERKLHWRNRVVAIMGPFMTSFTFAWMAAHRGRIRSVLLGGHRFGVIFFWDKGAGEEHNTTELDIAAIRVLTGIDPRVTS